MHNKTVSELKNDLEKKEVSSLELTQHFIGRVKKYDCKLNSFITLTEEHALNQAKKIDQEISRGEFRPLGGIPLAQKDIFCTKNIKTTCGSKMLENFISPYDATVVEKLNEAGMIIIGKTNIKHNLAKASVSATAVSDITGIPRATCIRKLEKLTSKKIKF